MEVLFYVGTILTFIGIILSFVSDSKVCLYVAYCSCMFGGLIFMSMIPTSEKMKLLEQASNKIEECQKELPRNQVCELKAVPVVKEDK